MNRSRVLGRRATTLAGGNERWSRLRITSGLTTGVSHVSDAIATPEESGDETLPRSKTELMERLDAAWSALQEIVGSATEDDLSAPGDDEGWSVKDHLAHLAIWERSAMAVLRGEPRHEAMGVDRATYEADDVDRINAAVQETFRDRSLADVRAFADETHRAMVDTLKPLTYDDLLRPYAHYQPGAPDITDPTLGWVVGNTYEHYDEHRGWIEAVLAAVRGDARSFPTDASG